MEHAQSPMAQQDPELGETLRAGAIQAFEFTYELAHKLLRRYLEATEANPEAVNEMSFPELIRKGYELGLLQSELVKWKEWRKARGTTSHTFDEDKAQEVYDELDDFYQEASYLLHQLQNRQNKL